LGSGEGGLKIFKDKEEGGLTGKSTHNKGGAVEDFPEVWGHGDLLRGRKQ